MAQNLAPKQMNFVSRYSAAVVAILAAADALTALDAEWTAEGYPTGGANPITDAVVQGVLPGATAALLNSAEGAVAGANAVLATIATNRGYLEPLRP